jgi:hypothetical protein
MFRLILFFSIIALAIAMIARWWFGIRILKTEGSRLCRCDLEQWTPPPGDKAQVHRAEESAAVFGHQLRLKALESWKKDDPKSAKSRVGAKRFGLAVPPLSGMVAVLAVFVGKMPIPGVAIIMIGATAVACVMSLLSLPVELSAITREAVKTNKQRVFPNRDDEEAVIHCAIAQAWEDALPPILKWFQKFTPP